VGQWFVKIFARVVKKFTTIANIFTNHHSRNNDKWGLPLFKLLFTTFSGWGEASPVSAGLLSDLALMGLWVVL
jgi:hypothetical protein